jgi:AcrR family transcriptional regulator
VTALPADAAGTTRERLVAAAIEVFAESGYEAARVQDVARAAGLTTGAIYANYRGKADLLFDAIGARADAEIDALLHGATGPTGRALLEVLGDRLVQRRAQPSLLLDAIVAGRRDESLAAMLRDRLDARSELVGSIIDGSKRDGTVDPDIDTRVLARFCMTLALGALALRAIEVEPPDPEGWHGLIARLLDACGPGDDAPPDDTKRGEPT